MSDYNVTMINGSTSHTMEIGEYSVSATYVPGYAMESLMPTSLSATSEGATGAFTLSANGTATFNNVPYGSVQAGYTLYLSS